MTTSVAILGTGKMGGAMARRLASSGFDMILWNRTAARAQELGIGRVVATPADAARDADVVISSLTNESAVREVYLSGDGVLRNGSGNSSSRRAPRAPESPKSSVPMHGPPERASSKRRWSAAFPRWRAGSCSFSRQAIRRTLKTLGRCSSTSVTSFTPGRGAMASG